MRDALFFVTLFICALTDIVTYRIRNVVLLISAAGLIFCDSFLFSGGGIREDLVSMGIIILVLFPFYLTGILAAGDIKLLALSAMYTGLSGFCSLISGAVLASTGLALILSIAKRESPAKVRFPFAFALFLGTIPMWFFD